MRENPGLFQAGPNSYETEMPLQKVKKKNEQLEHLVSDSPPEPVLPGLYPPCQQKQQVPLYHP